MKKLTNTVVYVALFTAFILGFADTADAQKRNERDIRDAVRSLNSKLDDFEYNLRNQMQNNSDSKDELATVDDEIRALRNAIFDFQENYDRKRENRDDVSKIVQAAQTINDGVGRAQLNRRVEDDWKAARAQIDRLSANYGVVNKWDGSSSPQYSPPVSTSGTFNVGLSGTYDLDRGRSENIDDVVSDTNLGNDQQQDLKSKLEAPEQIAIDIRGNQVTLATTNASPVTFIADGRDKVEKSPNGATIRLRATLSGNALTVASLGGETDYTITFTSVSNGRGMKVSRRITTDYLNQTVFAESVYNKSDSVARLGIPAGGNAPTDPNGGYSDNDQSGNVNNGGAPSIVTTKPGNYVVPNGVVITGRLDNEINTKISQNNDRFRMTVQSPDEFRGATVEGYISGINRSGKVTGQSKLTLNFERITLRNGQTYDFAGNLQAVQDTNGKVVKIDNEGTVKGDSQTKETAKRGGIGAGAGAILGAIIGGAKGAAIGAVIGGGAGAGSVVVTGKEDIRLMQGSMITVQSSSPANTGPR
ncbi:MAG: hypothetical protein WBD16_09910 [Pyrinomonadaceae bacterium]